MKIKKYYLSRAAYSSGLPVKYTKALYLNQTAICVDGVCNYKLFFSVYTNEKSGCRYKNKSLCKVQNTNT